MIEKLDVHINHYDTDLLCGQLVSQGKDIFFKYSKEYIEKGFNISPFKLAFNQEIQSSIVYYFENLFGVFHDSLPDGWGQLLMQRYFQDQNIPINDRNVLLQLSLHGMPINILIGKANFGKEKVMISTSEMKECLIM